MIDDHAKVRIESRLIPLLGIPRHAMITSKTSSVSAANGFAENAGQLQRPKQVRSDRRRYAFRQAEKEQPANRAEQQAQKETERAAPAGVANQTADDGQEQPDSREIHRFDFHARESSTPNAKKPA